MGYTWKTWSKWDNSSTNSRIWRFKHAISNTQTWYWTWSWDGKQWSTSCLDHFTPGKATPYPLYTGLRGPEKFPPSGTRTPNRPGRRLVTIQNSLSWVLHVFETHLVLFLCLAVNLSARPPAVTFPQYAFFPPSCDVHITARIHSCDNSRIFASITNFLINIWTTLSNFFIKI
jgi:hypothetical protein